jgi:hypothetical protein
VLFEAAIPLVTVPGETKGNHDGDRYDAEDHEAGKIQALGEQSEGPAKAGYKGGQDYGADEVSHAHGHNDAERIVNKRLIPLERVAVSSCTTRCRLWTGSPALAPCCRQIESSFA